MKMNHSKTAGVFTALLIAALPVVSLEASEKVQPQQPKAEMPPHRARGGMVPPRGRGEMFPHRGRGEMSPHRFRGGDRVDNMRRNAMIWRVFSELDDAERKKMQELQRENPEKFALEMRSRAEAFEKQEQEKVQKLLSLIDRYRKSSDKEERAKLKAEIAKTEKERFNKRLAGHERVINSTKRRLALMEEELAKRKAKKDAIVEARVEALLSGELPVMQPFNHSPGGKGAPRPHFPGRNKAR